MKSLYPEGDTGWIYIIYDQSKHPEIKKEDGIYTFPIGKDGILKVSNIDYAYGTSVDKFFYMDDEGHTIKELDLFEEVHSGNSEDSGAGQRGWLLGSRCICSGSLYT